LNKIDNVRTLTLTMQRSTPTTFGLSRRERILDELRRTGSVTVSGLAPELGVSELTVRRDIGKLAEQGLLTRVHGGAVVRSRLDRTPRRPQHPGLGRFRIGLVVPSLSYYWPPVITGARAAAAELGVQLVLRVAGYSVQDQRRQVASLLDAGQVHALLVAPETVGADGRAMLAWLDSVRIPVLLVERHAASPLASTGLGCVTTDHVTGAAIAAQHLAARGHVRVGLLSTSDSPTSWQLRQGWKEAVRELGLESPVDREATLDSMPGPERDAAIDALLQTCARSRTTALLIHNDPQAMLVQQRALDRGLRIPEDLAIMTYDDEVAAGAEPAITSLSPPKHHVGRLAVETLVAALDEGPGRPVQRSFVLPVLHPRDST
jgi:DNA-binding LacI/PurR family transcriptional regulator